MTVHQRGKPDWDGPLDRRQKDHWQVVLRHSRPGPWWSSLLGEWVDEPTQPLPLVDRPHPGRLLGYGSGVVGDGDV